MRHLKTRATNKKPHIQICITHTFEFINTTFFDLMLSLDTKYSYSMVRSNMLPIERNRTDLVERAMKNKEMTHCLFIDTDIVPRHPKFLDIMVGYDVPIVGLLCSKKVPPFEPILYKKDAPPEENMNNFWVKYPKGLVEVDATGTGCLLVKREVFEKMEKPYFVFHSNYQKEAHQSEDVYFLNNARNLGYKIYVDTENICSHYGQHGFSPELHKQFLRNAGDTNGN